MLNSTVEEAESSIASAAWRPRGAPARERSAEVRVRQDLARELHDRVSSILTTMLVDMERYRRSHREQPVAAQLSQMQDDTRLALNNLREVVSGLRGGQELSTRFVEAVRRDLVGGFSAETGIPAQVRVARDWPRRLSTIAATNLYHIIAEALSNIQRHSGARRASVSLLVGGGRATVIVRDQGRGFLRLVREGEAGCFGILGMRERAVVLGGELFVERGRSGGTIVRVVIPEARLT
jgi:two-component system, NarL family, sensor histidine kinase UhpB